MPTRRRRHRQPATGTRTTAQRRGLPARVERRVTRRRRRHARTTTTRHGRRGEAPGGRGRNGATRRHGRRGRSARVPRVAARRLAHRRALAIVPLPRVLLHRLVDQVVDAALELPRHLLERVPQDVAALERSRAFFVRIRAHRDPLTCLLGDSLRAGERWKSDRVRRPRRPRPRASPGGAPPAEAGERAVCPRGPTMEKFSAKWPARARATLHGARGTRPRSAHPQASSPAPDSATDVDRNVWKVVTFPSTE